MRPLTLALIALTLTSCSITPQIPVATAAQAISADTLLTEIKTLSGDDFEGRKPGTPGDAKTVAWLEQQFRQLGLEPGNPNKTYIQKVPLAGITSKPTANITAGGKKIALEPGKDLVAVSQRYTTSVSVADSEVVFVGYGADAPEYNWNDYKDVDVKGKTLLMLVNDPQIRDAKDPAKLDDAMFKGRAMTYYGRWTYKYEEATAKGAAAAIIIHETDMAAYPFSVVIDSWSGENFDIQHPDKNMSRVPVQGWITFDKAAELIKAAGLDIATLKAQALQRDFRPVTLPNTKASFQIENKLREIDSSNVIAKIPGSDPEHADQFVVYTAHWDHLGRDPELKGDQIFNGAVDNASGAAGLLEIARAFKKLSPAPRRSIIFLATTGEEQGLLGAAYYAANPLYPLNRTLADINMDSLNVWGKTKDMVIVGMGNSDIDDVATAVLKSHGRVAVPDAEPEKGMFYRSDHFEFAKQGVPAFDPDPGIDYIGKPANFGRTVRDDYTKSAYHKPADEVKSTWDLAGAVDDLRVFFEIGQRLADGPHYPLWLRGSEFKEKRDLMMLKP